MKHKCKSLFGILMVLIMMISLIPVQLVSASEPELAPEPGQAIVVTDADTLLELLEQDGDVYIRLGADISKRINNMGKSIWYTEPGFDEPMYTACWCHVGTGRKILDVFGHDLDISINFIYSDVAGRVYMFNIPSGCDMTIMDGYGKEEGKIHLDGYIKAATQWVFAAGFGNTSDLDVPYRDIFRVDGGSLTINGGQLDAGRSKKQWLVNAREGKAEYMDMSTVIPMGIWRYAAGWILDIVGDMMDRYDGYARQQVNSRGIVLLNGSVTVNSGVVEGRGFSLLKTDEEDENLTIMRGAAIEAHNGTTLTINGGTFNGLGCASVLSVESGCDCTVKGGVFLNKDLDKVVVPTLKDNFTRYIKGSRGAIGIPSGAIKDRRAKVSTFVDIDDIAAEKGFEGPGAYLNAFKNPLKEIPESEWGSLRDGTRWVYIRPASDITADPEIAIGSAPAQKLSDIGPEITWDGLQETTLTFKIPKYWPDDSLGIAFRDRYMYPYHQINGTYAVSKKLGVMPSITLTRGSEKEKVTSGGGMEDIIKEGAFKVSDLTWDPASDTWTMTASLKDVIPEDASVGDTYLVRLSCAEQLRPYYGSMAAGQMLSYTVDFTVKIKDFDIVITDQPATVIREYSGGEPAVLTAVAEHADGAFWQRVYPVKETLENSYSYAQSFDPETGKAVLKAKVGTFDEYQCVFYNKSGSKETDSAAVGVSPSASTADRSVTLYTGRTPTYLVPEGDFRNIDQRLRTVQWYFTPDGSSEEIALTEGYTLASGSKYTFKYGGDLCIDRPAADAAGIYRAEYTYDFGSEVKTGNINVTVVDAEGPASDPITSVEIFGAEDLNVGDFAPLLGDLWTEDPRVSIEEITWIAGVGSDGRIQSPNPAVKIKLRGTIFDGGAPRYPFQWSGESGSETFSWKIGGLAATQYPGSENVVGSGGQTSSVTLTYTWDSAHPLSTPIDSLSLSQSAFDVMEGEEVDILLDYTFTCNPRHGGVHHVTSLQSEGGSGSLPEGLALVSESDGWHIKGTISAEPTSEPIRSVIDFLTEDEGGGAGQTKNAILSFNIMPAATGFGMLPDEAELYSITHHVHDFGLSEDQGDGTHLYTCTICGHQEQSVHVWNEGTVTKSETVSESGEIVYTCIICGAVRTETTEPLKLDMVELSDPTVEAEGLKAFWIAQESGEIFADADGKKQLENFDSLIIPAVTYEITKGANASWSGSAAQGQPLDLTVNRSWKDESTLSHFKELVIDGKVVDAKNYKASSGSLNLSIAADYMSGLAEGSHDMIIRFDDADVETKFTVTINKDAAASGDNGKTDTKQEDNKADNKADDKTGTKTQDNKSDGKTGTKSQDGKAADKSDSKSALTGDNGHIVLWITLMIAAVIGICGTVLICMKRRNTSRR